jgi:hypothetical protein
MMNCRSNPVAASGELPPTAAADVVGRRPSSAPFTLAESLAAADVVWPDTELPREIAVAGIVFDMMPAHLSPRRDVVARRLRVAPDVVRVALLLWECADDSIRFDVVRRAVAIARARRIGG